MSKIEIVDLRKIKDVRGIRRFLSPELIVAMKETLERKEQILLFLNRRGFSNFSVCSACGEAIKCKNCDISLTLHKSINAFQCHYCGFTRAIAGNCAVCGSSDIRNLGIGTEKLESAVNKLFPEANTVRMDSDTTKKKGSILKILKDIRSKNIDILVGTQMVAKGHDFPDITLVGIICADLSLSFPDFRSGARTFQLLAQVAGRAGRGDAPGRVILQTYNPDHFIILEAKKQDFKSFYEYEIKFRKSLQYPPFSRLIMLKIIGKDYKKTKEHVLTMGEVISKLRKEKSFEPFISVLGPIESPLHRIAKNFRWQIILKGSKAEQLHSFINRLITERRSFFNNRQVKVLIDIDPVFMM